MNLSKVGELEMTLAMGMKTAITTPMAMTMATIMAKSQMKMPLMTFAKLFRHTIPVDANFDATHLPLCVVANVQ